MNDAPKLRTDRSQRDTFENTPADTAKTIADTGTGVNAFGSNFLIADFKKRRRRRIESRCGILAVFWRGMAHQERGVYDRFGHDLYVTPRPFNGPAYSTPTGAAEDPVLRELERGKRPRPQTPSP